MILMYFVCVVVVLTGLLLLADLSLAAQEGTARDSKIGAAIQALMGICCLILPAFTVGVMRGWIH